jgi:predicted DNA-binding antitoxin AbrB/MazE fold protein
MAEIYKLKKIVLDEGEESKKKLQNEKEMILSWVVKCDNVEWAENILDEYLKLLQKERQFKRDYNGMLEMLEFAKKIIV